MDNIHSELVYPHFWNLYKSYRRQASIIYRKFYGHTCSLFLLQLYLTFVQPHIEHAAQKGSMRLISDSAMSV